MWIIDTIYRTLTGDDVQAKAKSSAGSEKPAQAFVLQLISQLLTKIGDGLSSTKIVLPWVLSQVGAPAFFAGLLVPIRESGSLLPQLIISHYVAAYAIRKWFYVAGCVLQGASILAVAWVSATLEGVSAGATITALIIVFGLARGLCSVVSKDVLGKTIVKAYRGKLTGISASCAGLVTIAVGIAIFYKSNQSFNLTALLVFAGLSWWFAAMLFALISEPVGDKSDDSKSTGFLSQLSLLKDDKQFRDFVIVRSLLMSSGLSAPYFILLAKAQEDSRWLDIGLFMLVSGLASLLSGFIWGRFADQSSRRLLCLLPLLLAVLFSATGALALLNLSINVIWLVGLFFLLSILHQGVRVARKTYVVNLGEGNQRTYYVAVSNTIIGVLLLCVGLITAAIAQLSVGGVLAFFAITSIVAAMLAPKLQEV